MTVTKTHVWTIATQSSSLLTYPWSYNHAINRVVIAISSLCSPSDTLHLISHYLCGCSDDAAIVQVELDQAGARLCGHVLNLFEQGLVLTLTTT